MSAPTRWGILGTGSIAHLFARGLRCAEGSELVAVASRSDARAGEFARQVGAARSHGSYEALVSDPAVDVVYVATPHTRHRDDCILSLEAGKPVLCEKPFAMNLEQAREVVDYARRAGLFCMEAMWTRFIPALRRVKALVDSGEIGEIRMLEASLGYPKAYDEESRFFAPALGGGVLLDLGVYPVSLAVHLLGPPSEVASTATFAATGVEEQVSIVLSYPGTVVNILSSFRTEASNRAVIMGSRGRIEIESPLINPQHYSTAFFSEEVDGADSQGGVRDFIRENALVKRIRPLLRRDSKRHACHFRGNGYNYQAEEVTRCLRSGKAESDIMPLADTLQVMETLDAIRARWSR